MAEGGEGWPSQKLDRASQTSLAHRIIDKFENQNGGATPRAIQNIQCALRNVENPSRNSEAADDNLAVLIARNREGLDYLQQANIALEPEPAELPGIRGVPYNRGQCIPREEDRQNPVYRANAALVAATTNDPSHRTRCLDTCPPDCHVEHLRRARFHAEAFNEPNYVERFLPATTSDLQARGLEVPQTGEARDQLLAMDEVPFGCIPDGSCPHLDNRFDSDTAERMYKANQQRLLLRETAADHTSQCPLACSGGGGYRACNRNDGNESDDSVESPDTTQEWFDEPHHQCPTRCDPKLCMLPQAIKALEHSMRMLSCGLESSQHYGPVGQTEMQQSQDPRRLRDLKQRSDDISDNINNERLTRSLQERMRARRTESMARNASAAAEVAVAVQAVVGAVQTAAEASAARLAAAKARRQATRNAAQNRPATNPRARSPLAGTGRIQPTSSAGRLSTCRTNKNQDKRLLDPFKTPASSNPCEQPPDKKRIKLEPASSNSGTQCSSQPPRRPPPREQPRGDIMNRRVCEDDSSSDED